MSENSTRSYRGPQAGPPPPGPDAGPPSSGNHRAPSGGFGHSRKRMALEVAGVIGVLALLVWGAFAVLGGLTSALVGLMPISVDRAVGEAAWNQMVPAERRCTDPGPLAYIEQITAPLVEAYEGEHRFTFAVIDAPEVNAFALPGGFIAVHFGLLEQAESGEEVAAVLAHEIHHVTERHGLRRIARQLGTFAALGAVLGAVDLGSLTGLAVGLVGNAYDRDQEREADALGHALLIEADIDPAGMATFFDRLAARGPDVPALLSTHPGSDERAALARERGGLDGDPRALPAPTGLRCR